MKEGAPVLLLDIDGVLNTRGSRRRYGVDHVDPHRCAMLAPLINLGTVVVVSSDWAALGNWHDVYRPYLQDRLPLPVVGEIDKSSLRGAPGVRGRLGVRHCEVMRWADAHPAANWAAVDDLLICHRRAVRVGMNGLEPAHVARVRRILETNGGV